MNILLLFNRIPYPLKDGGAIAAYNMIAGLKAQGNTVDVFTLNTKKHYFPVNELPDTLTTNGRYFAADIDTSIKVLDAFLNLFTNESYNIKRFYKKEVEEQLIEVLKSTNYDLIQIEGLFMMPYINAIKSYSSAKISFRAHNVETQIWSRLAASSSGIKSRYLKLLSERIHQFEISEPNKVDCIVPITEEDAVFFREHFPNKKIVVSPAGVDVSHFISSDTKPEAKSLFHLGALNWLPNQEAVHWLCKDIFQKLIAKRNDFTLSLAGKNTPEEFYQYANANIVVLGEIDDAVQFMNSKSIMLVPLLSGSGMRLKIIEGMALGKAIISTSVGAEGIKYTNQHNIIIANTTDEFVNAIEDLLDHPEKITFIGGNAKQLILREYENQSVVNKLLSFYKEELI